MPKNVKDLDALQVAKAGAIALQQWNKDKGLAWGTGTNWSNVNGQFETFVNKYFFPKIQATDLINETLGNSWNFTAQEIDFIGQLNEEYVFLDMIPETLNLSKSELLMLKRNYPRIATKLYTEGQMRKVKFTLNNNDVRMNFMSLGDAMRYATGIYRKAISMINVEEEREIRGMMVDYAVNLTKDQRTATDENDLISKMVVALLNIQNNSEKHNEAETASGGALGRFTTVTDINNALILTTDEVKGWLLNTKIANTFANQGIDLTDKIISFDTLGGCFRMNEDITISEAATVAKFNAMGLYQTEIGTIIPKNSVVTWDVSGLTEFTGKVTEVKPKSDLFAHIFDVRSIRYRRYTKDMLKPNLYNGEFDEYNYWLHYYTQKNVSPFYNKITISGAAPA